jgi:uncharacterized protein YegP (UPF0339 family)
MSRTGSNPDRITVYKAFRDSDPMQLGVTTAEWRWTRRTTTNHRIVAASSEGYVRKMEHYATSSVLRKNHTLW